MLEAAEFEAELKRQLASSRYVYSDAAEVAKSGKGIQVFRHFCDVNCT